MEGETWVRRLWKLAQSLFHRWQNREEMTEWTRPHGPTALSVTPVTPRHFGHSPSPNRSGSTARLSPARRLEEETRVGQQPDRARCVALIASVLEGLPQAVQVFQRVGAASLAREVGGIHTTQAYEQMHWNQHDKRGARSLVMQHLKA